MVGTFGILVISHEGYHYFMIDGNPTGICLGKCSIGNSYGNMTNETWVTAAVHWKFTEEQNSKRDIMKEEIDAWIFAIAVTAMIMGLFIYSEMKR